MRCEAGSHADLGYILWSATTGFQRLRVLPRHEAEDAARTLSPGWLPPSSDGFDLSLRGHFGREICQSLAGFLIFTSVLANPIRGQATAPH